MHAYVQTESLEADSRSTRPQCKIAPRKLSPQPRLDMGILGMYDSRYYISHAAFYAVCVNVTVALAQG